MSEGRPPIPARLEREVLVEAGHRCAIPTCRQTPVQIHHIDDWSKVKEHRFENLIALCATCHDRVTRGYIDRQSVLRYKANLSVLNGRYGDVERRVLQIFADLKAKAGHWVALPGSWDVAMLFLLRDGLVVKQPHGGGSAQSFGMTISPERYVLTAAGEEFLSRWLTADPLP